MAKKIKLHTFHLLFRIFSYLADKSGGWSMFVKPKLVIGSLIVGINVVVGNAQNNVISIDSFSKQNKDSISELCYEPMIFVDTTPPEFPGGYDSLYSYIQNKIKYPPKAISQKIEGMVICTFTIDEKGQVTDLQVIKGNHPLLDNEVIRVLKEMPKWTPGEKQNKPVPVKITYPIRFTLPEKKN